MEGVLTGIVGKKIFRESRRAAEGARAPALTRAKPRVDCRGAGCVVLVFDFVRPRDCAEGFFVSGESLNK